MTDDELDRDDPGEESARLEGKRDRLARLLSVLRVLQAHGDAGISPGEIARRTGMSKRSIYRDLKALENEMQVPLWSDKGRWGVQPGAFLPPLRLTLQEAMAVFLSARLVTRYADKYEPALSSAFEKLGEALPDALRLHIERTLDDLAQRRVDPEFNRHVEDLTKAWAERRVVRFRYRPAGYDGASPEPRDAEVEPYLLEPSLATHALYLIGLDRTKGAIRTFKVERIIDLAVTPQRFDAPEAGGLATTLRRAWDIIADQPPTDVVLRFTPAVAARVQEATWHPSQEVDTRPDGSLEWRARVAGTIEIRLWILSWGDDVEVLEPASLRADVAATLARAAARYGDIR
ncbi:MAG TPA: WYL domain-containing protein [Candidatus Limnocylindrales bacterium]|nr:WYL domain-containing protein [Candidatus Limnocylindrales bacterium]